MFVPIITYETYIHFFKSSKKDGKMQFVVFPKIQKRHKAFFSKVLTLESINVKLQMSLQKGSQLHFIDIALLYITFVFQGIFILRLCRLSSICK